MMGYEWYELLNDTGEITQGDIIKGCPVPLISTIDIKDSIKAEITYVDGIILTQACDIENSKVDNIIICSITSKEDFEKNCKEKLKSKNEILNTLERIRKGFEYPCHLINKYESDGFYEDYHIINFKDIYSVPIDVVKQVAKKNGLRLRLLPPYREHLSQAFARYFMRVGLPVPIDFNKTSCK